MAISDPLADMLTRIRNGQSRGLPTVIRASTHYYNSEDEIDAVVAAVDEVR